MVTYHVSVELIPTHLYEVQKFAYHHTMRYIKSIKRPVSEVCIMRAAVCIYTTYVCCTFSFFLFHVSLARMKKKEKKTKWPCQVSAM